VVQISTVIPEKEHTKFVRTGNGRLKTTEPIACGRAQDIEDASQVLFPSIGQSRWEQLPIAYSEKKKFSRKGSVMVPTLSFIGKPLMPCHPARARELIKQGRAIKRWYKGIYSIKMLDRIEGSTQQIVIGIDPGTKREAFTVKSKTHTYLNILSDSVTWVSDRLKTRKEMRHSRRRLKTPYRPLRTNRMINQKGSPTSTISRWQIKINIIIFLTKLYPIKDIIVEDVKAKTIGKKKWDKIFSPLEMGKNWFYKKCRDFGNLHLIQGYETKKIRDQLGLYKDKSKMKENFWVHNIDSWAIANFITDGHTQPEMINLLRIIPLQLYRRQLHFFQPGSNGIRKSYGGTLSMGLKRGSVVKSLKWGLTYIGGTSENKISLHDITTGKRLTQLAKKDKLIFLYYNNWKSYWIKEINNGQRT
jgi:hypothetical protein